MQCIKDPETECGLELEDYQKAASATLDVIQVIADVLKGKQGWTGRDDCDVCDIYTLPQAIDIFNALNARFAIIPVKVKVLA